MFRPPDMLVTFCALLFLSSFFSFPAPHILMRRRHFVKGLYALQNYSQEYCVFLFVSIKKFMFIIVSLTMKIDIPKYKTCLRPL